MRAQLLNNRVRLITIAILAILFLLALQGMETSDWVITVLRGLSLGMITFLVASGLSLIFGLMDVLNLAHGELFMLGAYVGWTVFVRPDTFVDVLTPLALLAIGFVLLPLWRVLLYKVALTRRQQRVLAWAGLIVGVVITAVSVVHFPIAVWNPEVYSESPITYSLALSQDNLNLPAGANAIDTTLLLAILGTLLGSALIGLAYSAFTTNRELSIKPQLRPAPMITAVVLLLVGLVTLVANDALTQFLLDIGTTWRFFLAIGVAMALGLLLGAFIETSLIRPLYKRPIYQLMITLGLSFILIEVVRVVWGRPEFTMPKAALFNGTGDGCPARSLGDLIAHQCSTVILFDGRIRTYNEIFIIIVGLIVLVAVWLLIQRTRIGMIIRAGVQDREMVEAMGINVRRVFTFVFALGVSLATLGGVLAAPSIGLSSDMGTRLLLLALIALAIGGLTSFPGAAAGAILVGLLQQFIIKYGQIGIQLPFMSEPFKPSPPLVPASTVLLMVIILLVLPNGLFGRNE
ncbi:MAG: branched-chain amino acid ABC transporter permease [Anaerolineae bacterium]|nr:branched-chain amino acid ABC transporter permease [Anaerolineae bacterium]